MVVLRMVARARPLAESRTAHAATRVHLRVCPSDLDFLQQRHEPRPFRLLGTFTGHFAARPPSRKSSAPGGAICPPARRRRRKFWRAKRWGHFCMEKVECPRTSAVPPPAVLPHVTYRCPTQVHMWPPIERRAYVPSRPSTQVPFTVLLKAWIRIVRYLDIRVTTPSG